GFDRESQMTDLLTQVNGQRRYGGPPERWDGPVPGARCEVFISQIPRDTYEDLLIPLFSSVGPLWEFRLMMNFSGQNRGFAYAKYGSAAVATEAIRTLNGYLIEPGWCLSVRRSTEKRQLSMGGLPPTKAEGVERVSLKAGLGIEGVSAIVVFTSHYAASMAKKMLVEAFKKHFSLSVSVKWQSSGKPSPEEPMPSQKAFLPSPTKLPRLLVRPKHLSQPSLPSPFLRTPCIPPGFCRTVGGPTAQLQIPPPPGFYSLPPPLLDRLLQTFHRGFVCHSPKIQIIQLNTKLKQTEPYVKDKLAYITLMRKSPRSSSLRIS
uniref:RRM domain-containing protein n=1 Tax=Periophthalmus magnuspinnatus TaxID=409849 RepID=A0A3B4ATW5_9GOBI